MGKGKLDNTISRAVLGFITYYLFFSGAYHTITGDFLSMSDFINNLKEVKPNDISAQVIETVTFAENCKFNEAEWEKGFGKLENINGYNSYLLTSTTQSGLLRLKKSISSKGEVVFSFTPKSLPKSNVAVLVHNFFELVIGDGDNQRVTMKAKLPGHRKMVLIPANNDEDTSFLLDHQFALEKEVAIRLIHKPIDQDSLELILTVYYYSEMNVGVRKSVTKEYKLPIPSYFKDTEKPLRLSVGILNTDNKEDISVQFNCFKVSTEESSNLSYIGNQRN